ncbi:iron-containing alcohol dehydrogenase [Maribellus comscasis]|uniref:Iron-containing alcohol dehydrogenase n=1 Tax=Maribellus comscasis TaxID=2681766 RepID=A0A6I6JU53_9BACT|nr:iron-containing alcohol dehydrogenase [Maribellus comscasis]QGY43707.1 iron-containing alcohol dehydrogenase [Maribellus comscasis]
MSLSFEFATATRIIFGNLSVEKLPDLIASMGNNILLVTGKNTDRAEEVLSKIQKRDCRIAIFSVESEPTTTIIDEGINLARVEGCNLVVGLGGGSVIDSAKAIAAMVPNKGELLDYLEVIGQGKALVDDPLPCIAVPTTSGTGAEVTKNSVIKSVEHNVKVSLRSSKMYPDVALVDPVLTHSMSPELTASTGVDALTHLLETFVSNQANPFVDLLCREGMERISTSLERAYKNGEDAKARENMSMASMLGGMALANVKLGAVHGFAGPMGGMFSVAHGAVCACLLPPVMEVNIKAIKEQNEVERLKKYDVLAKILTGDRIAHAEDAIGWVNALIKDLNIPSLSKFGLTTADFPELIKKAKVSSSMKGNPVLLDDGKLMTILEKSL